MARDKKSFLLYADLVSVVEKLIIRDREDATNNSGELFYHILQYVNDRNPQPENFIIEMTFEPIKLQLKRDLKKYEDKQEKNRENANKRWNATAKKEVQNDATACDRINRNANDADNGNDNGNDNVIYNREALTQKEERFKEMIKPYVSEFGKDLCNSFFLYWSEPNKSKTKLRYELERTWDTKRRLSKWAGNDKKFKPRIEAQRITSNTEIEKF